MSYRCLRYPIKVARRCWNFTAKRLSSEASGIEVQQVDLTKPQTVVCLGGTIACWHPDQPFPYEHTRPINIELLKKDPQTSVFNDEVLKESLKGGVKKGPRPDELEEIFYTTKHEWYPKYREKKLHAVSAPIPKRK